MVCTFKAGFYLLSLLLGWLKTNTLPAKKAGKVGRQSLNPAILNLTGLTTKTSLYQSHICQRYQEFCAMHKVFTDMSVS